MNPTHKAALEEAIQTLDSAIAHNTKMGRTVLVHSQRTRADGLKALLADLTKGTQNETPRPTV